MLELGHSKKDLYPTHRGIFLPSGEGGGKLSKNVLNLYWMSEEGEGVLLISSVGGGSFLERPIWTSVWLTRAIHLIFTLPCEWSFLRGCLKGISGGYDCQLPLISAIFPRGKVKNFKYLRGTSCWHFGEGFKIFTTFTLEKLSKIECCAKKTQ